MEKSFERNYGSLPQVFAFLDEFFAGEGIDGRRNPVIALAIEELFTNMVKYGRGSGQDISIALDRHAAQVSVTLTDFDVEPFDVTRLPEVPVDRPLNERKPGGLGIHLVRKMVDSIEYDYCDRTGRTTFMKALE